MFVGIGCGHCWSLDGNWKISFAHCRYPVKTTVPGFPVLNYPDVCTEEALPHHAFCSEHCALAEQKGIPTGLQEYARFKAGKPMA